jgi:hypothetical protein
VVVVGFLLPPPRQRPLLLFASRKVLHSDGPHSACCGGCLYIYLVVSQDAARANRRRGRRFPLSLSSCLQVVARALGEEDLCHVLTKSPRGAKDKEDKRAAGHARDEEGEVSNGTASAEIGFWGNIGFRVGGGRAKLEVDDDEFEKAESDEADGEAEQEPPVVDALFRLLRHLRGPRLESCGAVVVCPP